MIPRPLSWEELRALAASADVQRAQHLNLLDGGDRGELVSWAMNSQAPMTEEECTPEQRSVVDKIDAKRRAQAYGVPPSVTPWVGGRAALAAAAAERQAEAERLIKAARAPARK